jgi:hypothetical protein
MKKDQKAKPCPGFKKERPKKKGDYYDSRTCVRCGRDVAEHEK